MTRWAALVLVVGLLVGGAVLDEADGPATDRQETDARTIAPVANRPDSLGSTWFCAGGTAESGGFADHVVRAANPTDDDRQGTVSIFPGGAEAVDVPFEVPAHDVAELRLADHVDAAFAAALVEFDGGGTVVEHQVSGETGTDVAPCSPDASSTWYFAAGTTTRDARYLLVFFNPFSDAAVVDVTFRTEDDVRTPEAFEGLVVPGGSVVVRDVGEVVTRRDHVSASVVARTGRLVIDRITSFDGTEGRTGLNVGLGGTGTAPVWYLPDGSIQEDTTESYVVYNPTDSSAEVDLELRAGAPEVGEIEPFQLTVAPEGFEEVVVSQEPRVAEALSAAGVESFLHSASAFSVNGVPVVVERQVSGPESASRPGLDVVLGSPLESDRAVVVSGSSDPATEALVVQNPSDEDALVTVQAFVGGEQETVAEDVEVPAAGRATIVLEDATLPGPFAVLIESDRPVITERRLLFGDEASASGIIATPLAGSEQIAEPII